MTLFSLSCSFRYSRHCRRTHTHTDAHAHSTICRSDTHSAAGSAHNLRCICRQWVSVRFLRKDWFADQNQKQRQVGCIGCFPASHRISNNTLPMSIVCASPTPHFHLLPFYIMTVPIIGTLITSELWHVLQIILLGFITMESMVIHSYFAANFSVIRQTPFSSGGCLPPFSWYVP